MIPVSVIDSSHTSKPHLLVRDLLLGLVEASIYLSQIACAKNQTGIKF